MTRTAPQLFDGVGRGTRIERMRALDLARLALLLLVAGAGVAGAGATSGLAGLSAGYAMIAAVRYLVGSRRRAPRERLRALPMLALDACYLAAAMAVSGGLASPLRYLVLAHLVAAALLASARSCALLLAWHTVLLLGVAAARGLALWPTGGLGPAYPAAEVLAFAAGMWVVGAATCAASAVNERVVRRTRTDIEGLAGAMTALEGRDTPAAVAQALVDTTAATYGFRRAVLVDARGDTVLAGTGGARTTSAAVGREGGPARVLDAAVEADHPILVDHLDPVDDALLARVLPDARNLVIVPLSDDDRRIATLVLEHAAERIDPRTVDLVRRVAAHAALALSSAHLVEQLRGRADRDGLTDVANRGALDRELDARVAHAAETGEPLGVLLVDIDHFKRLNDTHGHLAGDEVLQQVAQSLMERCRPGDFVGRYGGEEFGVVLPGAGPEEAEAVAERLRAGVAGLACPASQAAPVTVSIGYACMPHHGHNVAALIATADVALYAAKAAGRNRVGRPEGTSPGGAPAG